MKRQIEFRYYDKSLKKMIYTTILQYHKYDAIFEFMQFTGLQDAEINGNDVFEGDIIQNCDTKELQIVYWNENKAAWYCKYLNSENDIVSLSDSLGNLNKVIGNVFENPDLLNL